MRRDEVFHSICEMATTAEIRLANRNYGCVECVTFGKVHRAAVGDAECAEQGSSVAQDFPRKDEPICTRRADLHRSKQRDAKRTMHRSTPE